MTILEFIKEKTRLTRQCNMECAECRLHRFNNPIGVDCEELEAKYPEVFISIIKDWNKDCPRPTYKEAFVQTFPNTPLNYAGIPDFCVNLLGPIQKMECGNVRNCMECWNQKTKDIEIWKRVDRRC